MLLKRYNINIETRHSPSASIKKKKSRPLRRCLKTRWKRLVKYYARTCGVGIITNVIQAREINSYVQL